MVGKRDLERREEYNTLHIINDINNLKKRLLNARAALLNIRSAEMSVESQTNPEKFKSLYILSVRLARKHLAEAGGTIAETIQYDNALQKSALKLSEYFSVFNHNIEEFENKVVEDCGKLKDFLHNTQRFCTNMCNELNNLENQGRINIQILNGIIANLTGKIGTCLELVSSYNHLLDYETSIFPKLS